MYEISCLYHNLHYPHKKMSLSAPLLFALVLLLQVWRTALHVKWKLEDPESQLHEHYISLLATDASLHQHPTLKVQSFRLNLHCCVTFSWLVSNYIHQCTQVYGDVEEYIFSNLSLYDGEYYSCKIISCNRARLCTTTSTDNILVG